MNNRVHVQGWADGSIYVESEVEPGGYVLVTIDTPEAAVSVYLDGAALDDLTRALQTIRASSPASTTEETGSRSRPRADLDRE